VIVVSLLLTLCSAPASAGLWHWLFGAGCVEQVPSNLCARVYDEDDCGGWQIDVPVNSRMDWHLLNPSGWLRRNDIESISVRAGCTFTGWDDSFSGQSISVSAPLNGPDKHINTRDSPYSDLHEDIESLACFCE